MESHSADKQEYLSLGSTTEDTLGLFETLSRRFVDGDTSGLSRFIEAIMAQKQGKAHGGDEGLLFTLRVLLLLWSVSHPVLDDNGIPQLSQPEVMADVGLLLCRPSLTIPSQIAGAVRKTMNEIIKASMPLLKAYVFERKLPTDPTHRHLLFSLMAYLGIPQRDKLDLLCAAWAKLVQTERHTTLGGAAKVISSVLADAPAEVQSCILRLLTQTQSK